MGSKQSLVAWLSQWFGEPRPLAAPTTSSRGERTTRFARALSGLALSPIAQRHFEKFPPVFVVGAPRSGTTLVLRVGSLHPLVSELFEPRNIWFDIHGLGVDDSFRRSSPLRFALQSARYYQKVLPDRPYLLVKDPADSVRISAIRQAIPSARFIHVVRDGRDVVASIMKGFEKGTYVVYDGWSFVRIPGFRSLRGAPDHVKAALIWRLCVDAADSSLDNVAPDRRFVIRYEDFLDNPGSWSQRLVDFIAPGAHEVASTDVVGHIHRTPGESSSAWDQQHRWIAHSAADDAGSGTLSTGDRVGKWRTELSAEVLAEILPLMQDLLIRHGYASPT